MGEQSPEPADTPTGAVFLSYASQDAEAAQQILQEVRELSAGVFGLSGADLTRRPRAAHASMHRGSQSGQMNLDPVKYSRECLRLGRIPRWPGVATWRVLQTERLPHPPDCASAPTGALWFRR